MKGQRNECWGEGRSRQEGERGGEEQKRERDRGKKRMTKSQGGEEKEEKGREIWQ